MKIGHFPARCALAAFLAVILLSGCTTPGDSAERDARAHFPVDPNGALFADAFENIEEYYLEPVTPETVSLAGLKALGPADGHFLVDSANGTITIRDGSTVLKQIPAPDPTDVDGWAAVVSTGMALARQHAPALAKLSDDQLDQAVFTGVISKLDRFTRYAPPKKANRQRDDRDGFGGIGIVLDDASKAIRVRSVIPDTPAFHAGMAEGDVIVAVDGKPVAPLDRDQIIDILRGPEGSAVVVSVTRAGSAKPIELHMNRALIVPPTVVAEKGTPGIAVLRITEFNHDTGSSLKSMLASAIQTTPGGLKGVVLDLRGNPGGLLDQAADVASIFVKQGEIISTKGRASASNQDFKAEADDYLTDLPMVVLVNGGSASASEVVASTLEDNGRAAIVGSSSYGKGTVQIVLSLENDGEFTLTWARLFPPGGYILHHHGVVPLFCTSLPDAGSAAHVIEAGQSRSGLWTKSRSLLSEEEWKTLRHACPPATEDNPLDLPVAEHLIEDAAAYGQAIEAMRRISVPSAASKTLADLPPP
jgi:carboxyl-terminal processing protease